MLYARVIITVSLIDATKKISAARDELSGPGDDDQGIRVISGPPVESNVVRADSPGSSSLDRRHRR